MAIPLLACHILLLAYCVSLGAFVMMVSGRCSPDQQQSLLLQLKTSLNFEPALSTKLIGNLSEIVELHLDGVNISSSGAQWCRAISSSLPKLRVLSLSSCNLLGPIDDSLLKLKSLSEICLDSNNLLTPVPKFLSKFTNLTESIFDLHGLYILSLSSNNFSGSFLLDNVQQLKNLSFLHLSYNSLSISYNSNNSSVLLSEFYHANESRKMLGHVAGHDGQ